MPIDPCLNPLFPNPKPVAPFQDWNNDNQGHSACQVVAAVGIGLGCPQYKILKFTFGYI